MESNPLNPESWQFDGKNRSGSKFGSSSPVMNTKRKPRRRHDKGMGGLMDGGDDARIRKLLSRSDCAAPCLRLAGRSVALALRRNLAGNATAAALQSAA
jgi:hypothetical protein